VAYLTGRAVHQFIEDVTAGSSDKKHAKHLKIVASLL
jgi:hypothetical protein